MDSIRALLRLFGRSVSWTAQEARELYQLLIIFLGVLVFIVLVGFVCNITGIKGVNIFFSLLFVSGVAVFAYQPIVLAITAGIGGAVGALRQDQSASRGAIAFLERYLDLLKHVLLWGSVILFLLGTLSFQESPFAFFSIVAAVIALAFIKWVWGIGGTWGRHAIYWYVSAVVVILIASLVPGPVWDKYTPFAGKPTEIGASRTESTLYEIRKAREEQKEEAENKVLSRILKKVKAGEQLTPEEGIFLRQKESELGSVKFLKPTAVSGSQQGSPSLGDLEEWRRSHWFWIISVLVLASIILTILGKPWAKTLQWIPIGMFAALFVFLPIVHAIWGDDGPVQTFTKRQPVVAGRCTSAQPCAPASQGNGSTVPVAIPEGSALCHDPEFWTDLPRLGFKTTFKNGPVRGVGVPADSFWYEPQPGVSIPRYWFVPEGTKQC